MLYYWVLEESSIIVWLVEYGLVWYWFKEGKKNVVMLNGF